MMQFKQRLEFNFGLDDSGSGSGGGSGTLEPVLQYEPSSWSLASRAFQYKIPDPWSLSSKGIQYGFVYWNLNTDPSTQIQTT